LWRSIPISLTNGNLGSRPRSVGAISIMCDSRYSSANISNKPPRTAFCSSGAIVPSFLINLVLETDRMRSKAINPSRPSKQTGILLGYCFPLVVIGATMTVARCRFISLGKRLGKVWFVLSRFSRRGTRRARAAFESHSPMSGRALPR
jgi:hypothetical protein